MTTKDTVQERDDRLEIPLDLTQWIDGHELQGWVEEEVGKLDWANPELMAYLKAHPDYRPRTLLNLITFGHLTQVFGSEELCERCFTDPFYRFIAEKVAPDAAEVMRFRRENRGLIKILLATLILRAATAKFGLGGHWIPAGVKRSIVDNAVERLDSARHIDRAEE